MNQLLTWVMLMPVACGSRVGSAGLFFFLRAVEFAWGGVCAYVGEDGLLLFGRVGVCDVLFWAISLAPVLLRPRMCYFRCFQPT